MYKKFKKVFLVMSILGILFTNNYANEIKEVQLIDDFSEEILGETKNQEAEVPKPPVQQQIQEITEEKNIGEEQIEKSFELFYSEGNTKNSNGLGLYIIKNILTNYNIDYSFEKSKIGMVFKFRIPIKESK